MRVESEDIMANALLGIGVYLAVAICIAFPVAHLSVKVWKKSQIPNDRLPKWAFLLFPVSYLEYLEGRRFTLPYTMFMAELFMAWFEEDSSLTLYVGLSMMFWPLRLSSHALALVYCTLFLFVRGLGRFIAHTSRFFVPKQKM